MRALACAGEVSSLRFETLEARMDEGLNLLRQRFLQDAAAVSNAEALSALKDKYLGRKSGLVAAEKKRIGALSPEQRADFGRQINELGVEVETEIGRLAAQFAAEAEAAALSREA